jgi:hypothetical protein
MLAQTAPRRRSGARPESKGPEMEGVHNTEENAMKSVYDRDEKDIDSNAAGEGLKFE